VIRRTLGTLTDTDVKERRTVTLGTLTGRLRGVIPLLDAISVHVDCGGVQVWSEWLPAETPVEVRA
jgi:hypothetical protein